ncbi:MAG: hypothetical protein ACJASB_000096 [Shewanella psychromarinicola]|jgi:hypothetical protein|uniref:hypothetical protein n=1 Tax=Shewanella psychromarinicola TaxID=2487742 RepID=UPI003EEB092A
MATFSLFENVAVGWANYFISNKEGTAVGLILVWCGRSATTLVVEGHILNQRLS